MTSTVTGPRGTAEQFRDVMAQVPAAVAVLTTHAGGAPHGTTVSAFVSVSLDPPTMLVSLDNASVLLSKLEPGTQAALNVLTADQAELAGHFAHKHKDDAPVSWKPAGDQPPRLPGCAAWIALTVAELIAVSDHTLVICTVNTAHTTTAPPLLHWQHTYGTPRIA